MIKDLEQKHNCKTKYLRCDNAGENHKTEEECYKQGLGITFEYTLPNTPHQNGKVERRFATLYGRVRAMLNGARLTKKLRGSLWTECARTATYQDNLDCENESGKTKHF